MGTCACLQVRLLSVGYNNLRGPAFPQAWLRPPKAADSQLLPALMALELSGNRCLTGTLPAHLPWPSLITL